MKFKTKITFFVSGFLILLETFILTEITVLLYMEYDFVIFAQRNPNKEKIHYFIEKYQLIKRIHYLINPKNKIKHVVESDISRIY